MPLAALCCRIWWAGCALGRFAVSLLLVDMDKTEKVLSCAGAGLSAHVHAGANVLEPSFSIAALQNESTASFPVLQVPGGLRMGTPALTSRGFVESDFQQVADFVHRCVLFSSSSAERKREAHFEVCRLRGVQTLADRRLCGKLRALNLDAKSLLCNSQQKRQMDYLLAARCCLWALGPLGSLAVDACAASSSLNVVSCQPSQCVLRLFLPPACRGHVTGNCSAASPGISHHRWKPSLARFPD